jgi:hypothetical protein
MITLLSPQPVALEGMIAAHWQSQWVIRSPFVHVLEQLSAASSLLYLI